MLSFLRCPLLHITPYTVTSVASSGIQWSNSIQWCPFVHWIESTACLAVAHSVSQSFTAQSLTIFTAQKISSSLSFPTPSHSLPPCRLSNPQWRETCLLHSIKLQGEGDCLEILFVRASAWRPRTNQKCPMRWSILSEVEIWYVPTSLPPYPPTVTYLIWE